MPLRSHALPAGFIAPCVPTRAAQPPSGAMWLPEIKHDGFRVIARKNAKRVKLYSRPGNDLTYRFPLIVEALARLRSRSCIISRNGDRRLLTRAALFLAGCCLRGYACAHGAARALRRSTRPCARRGAAAASRRSCPVFAGGR